LKDLQKENKKRLEKIVGSHSSILEKVKLTKPKKKKFGKYKKKIKSSNKTPIEALIPGRKKNPKPLPRGASLLPFKGSPEPYKFSDKKDYLTDIHKTITTSYSEDSE
jgi:hypothetical protein